MIIAIQDVIVLHFSFILNISKIGLYNSNLFFQVSGFDVGCDISPDGKIIASGNAEGHMVFYDYQFGRMLSKLNADSNNDVILNVVWHPVLYSTVAVSTWNGQIQIWQ